MDLYNLNQLYLFNPLSLLFSSHLLSTLLSSLVSSALFLFYFVCYSPITSSILFLFLFSFPLLLSILSSPSLLIISVIYLSCYASPCVAFRTMPASTQWKRAWFWHTSLVKRHIALPSLPCLVSFRLTLLILRCFPNVLPLFALSCCT